MENQPIYIFGPCSAESREQVLDSARQLKEACGGLSFIYRAGVWKPRSRPDTFRGAGAEGLQWLAEVRDSLGLPVATEVATPEHVDAALKAGIEYIWIGARTSANPIAVQAIADKIYDLRSQITDLQGVFIKNPVNADAGLWLGNIERLEKTGLPVIAVHRGCNHQPCWAMAHTIRIARPDIPMLLDPSHMSGDAAKVPGLMQKVTELGLNGAMIEVHAHPEAALSDAEQQITPAALTVALKDRFAEGAMYCKTADAERPELNWLRAEIDELDDRLWETIAARMDVSQRIGTWKKANGIAPLQPERFQQILAARQEWANKNGIDAAFVKRIFDTIHEESLKKQTD